MAVDPAPVHREMALKFGATDVFETLAQATDLAQALTDGQGAASAIVTVGVVTGEHVAEAFAAVRKSGTIVLTSMGNVIEYGIPVSLFELAMYQKRIQGSLFGMMQPTRAVTDMLQLYKEGKLLLEELVTRRYRLEEILTGYGDMQSTEERRDGKEWVR